MSSPSSDPHYAPGGVQEGSLVAGKYRVGKMLGAGGMGVVLAAAHEALGTPMALKVLRPEAVLSPGMVGRFLQEARAAALLQSEHVARVHDFGTLDDGSPYLAMEYLHGRDLSYVLEKRPRLTVAESVEIMRQTCDAVAEAHSAGIVHRDLKPHNLFLLQRPNHAIFVKVLDFGIAKILGSERFRVDITTQSTAMLGTPLYMAPEQLKAAKTADGRSDIWSLGVIFHQMLTGRVPFEADTLPELSVMVLTTDAAPIDRTKFDVPEEIVHIVSRCLRRDPAERFANVEELAMALDPFVSNRRVSIPDLSSPVLDSITTGPRRALEVGDTAFPSSRKLAGSWPHRTPAPGSHDLGSAAPRRHLHDSAGGIPAISATLGNEATLRVEPPPGGTRTRKRVLFGLTGLGVVVGGALAFTLGRHDASPRPASSQAPPAAVAPEPIPSASAAPLAASGRAVSDWAAVPVPSVSAVADSRGRKERAPRASVTPSAPPPPAAPSATLKMGPNGAPILAN